MIGDTTRSHQARSNENQVGITTELFEYLQKIVLLHFVNVEDLLDWVLFSSNVSFNCLLQTQAKIKWPEPLVPRQQALTAKPQVRLVTGCSWFSAVPPHCESKTRVTFRRRGTTIWWSLCFEGQVSHGQLQVFQQVWGSFGSLPDPAVNSTSRKLTLHIQWIICQFSSQGWPTVGWDRCRGKCKARKADDAEQNQSLKIQ